MKRADKKTYTSDSNDAATDPNQYRFSAGRFVASALAAMAGATALAILVESGACF